MEASECGRLSAVSEHEDNKTAEKKSGRRTAEETGRGDGRMEADEAGTAMTLRGEHDARSASTQKERRLN